MRKIKYSDLIYKYEQVIENCKKEEQPFYLVNNEQIELVIMDVDSYKKRDQMLKVQQLVLDALATRLVEGKDYSLSESRQLINEFINDK